MKTNKKKRPYLRAEMNFLLSELSTFIDLSENCCKRSAYNNAE
jgi:hypothetical protein